MSETGIETTKDYSHNTKAEERVRAGVIFLAVQLLTYVSAAVVIAMDTFVWRP